APAVVDLGGRQVRTWAFRGSVPGPELRARAGATLRVRLENGLPAPTTVHWHGIAIRNDMDGVPGLTQRAVAPGGRFLYEFRVPHPGTYFYHPHVGVQVDRGLYGVLVVEDQDEPGRYDREAVVVLDDWTDGVGASPDRLLASLRRGGMGEMDGMDGMDGMAGMGGMPGMGGGRVDPLGGDPGDIQYPLYLLNGRPPAAPATLAARPGQRIRLRIVNAGADTAFRVALGGHRLTVTHADGWPVRPVTADALLVGMGERYDVVAELGDGAFPLVAVAEGKGGRALAVVRTARGRAPRPDVRLAELGGRPLTVAGLRAADGAGLGRRAPDRTHRLLLAGDMATYRWTINGQTMGGAVPFEVRQGERVRLVFDNRSPMFHPMHLHGHTFQVRRQGERAPGPRKDTVIVRPGERVTVEFEARNPGRWMLHCHNAYHAASGMMSVLEYAG
ncbi:MAG TPA: multicopper oxidase family protein, partial [Actinomycetes bacterium]|nr:multicopper oxidase family protein [Actinomycetes bacterium]